MYSRWYIMPSLVAVMVIVDVVNYYKFVDKNAQGTRHEVQLASRKVQGTRVYQPAGRQLILIMDGYQGKSKASGLINDGDYKCIVMNGGTDPTKADPALFQEKEIALFGTPPVRYPQDLWAFFGHEAQMKLLPVSRQKKWDGMFNYSATFNRNNEGRSHVYLPKLMRKSPPTTHYYRPKPKMRPLRALWLVSHCMTPTSKKRIYSAREEYVRELSKYITINIYSRRLECFVKFGNLTQSSKELTPDEIRLDDYAFYLAFENNICQDYITEKLWKVLKSNSTAIPVVLGGLSIENYEYVAPPNSFIRVRNFTSPEALANHLKFVSQDNNAFHYYNQWRNEYWLKTTQLHNRAAFYEDYYEYFCKLIYERPHKVWYNFSKDHSPDQCIDVSKPEAYCPYYNMSCNKQNLIR